MTIATSTEVRSISDIAAEISREWKNVNYAARPYLEAMFTLTSFQDKYGYDSAAGIVLRFLNNAGSWRGETAKRIKAELKAMTKGM